MRVRPKPPKQAPPLDAPAYKLSVSAVIKQLQTDPEEGLCGHQVVLLRRLYGGNLLEKRGRELVMAKRNAASVDAVMLAPQAAIAIQCRHYSNSTFKANFLIPERCVELLSLIPKNPGKSTVEKYDSDARVK